MRSSDAIVALRFVPADQLYAAFAALSAGQFGTLNTPTMNDSVINNGSADSIMSWARRGHFDPGADRAYFYGCTHNNSDSSENYNYVIRYATSTHAWVKEAINDPEPFSAGGIHGYYHHALRQSDGHQFLRQRGSANIFNRARDAAWGSATVPDLPGTLFIEWNVANALEWYPDFGSAGALVFASTSRIYTWETGNPSWTLRGSFGGSSDNDNWICYNRANGRMYCGGPTVMRRLDPNGTVVTCASTPFNCGASPQTSGNQGPVVSSGLAGNRMFAVNPSGFTIREYDHVGDSWPAATVGTLPFTPDLGLYFHVTVPNHGVFFHYISGNPSPSPTMHLWRR